MIRKKCANCGFIFDVTVTSKKLKCPKCRSNAVDDYNIFKYNPTYTEPKQNDWKPLKPPFI